MVEFKSIASLNRFREVTTTLLRYGFDDLVQRLDLPGKTIAQKITHVAPDTDVYARIRLAIEELGPTFIKFGQIMSLRSDILPRRLTREFFKLQDEVPPERFEDIRPVLEKNLQQPLDRFFVLFDEEPVAAASLSQVHRGTLREGSRMVAVKVQRPGIRRKIETDLNILAFIAERLHANLEDLRMYELPDLVRLVRRSLRRETDFSAEARYMRIARARMTEFNGIYIPEPLTEHCTEQLLVMEYVEGRKLKDLEAGQLLDPAATARLGLEVAVKQILEDGFFHADPHPGNLLIGPQDTIYLLDWGMVGRLTQEDRFELIDMLGAMVQRDGQKLVEAIRLITTGNRNFDPRALERDILDILDHHFAVPVSELNVGRMLMDTTDLLRQYRLKIPPDLFIMIKGLITAEGTVRQIDPQINFAAELQAHMRRLTTLRYGPGIIWRSLRSGLSRFVAAPGKLPQRMLEIVEKLEKGDLNIRFQHANLSGFRATLEEIFSRLSLAVIIAAMIIGSSMVITTGVRPLLFGYPAFGIIGYVISGMLGIWLIIDILRSRRR